MTTVKDDEDEETQEKAFPLRFFNRLRTDLWLTISQLVNPLAEGDEDVGRSQPLKILNMAWGFFLFFAMAVYSANLTAFMVKKTLKMPIRNINDCVAQRCAFCIDQFRLNDMQEIYAQKIHYKVYDHATGVIAGITNKECDAALVEERFYRLKHDLHHPDLVFVGQAILSFFVGWPATPEVRSTISYLMSVIEGSADSSVYKEIEGTFMPPMRDDPFRDPMAQPEGEDAEQFGIDSMVGVLIMSAVLLSTSIFLVIIKLICNQIRPRRGKVQDVEAFKGNGVFKEGADIEGGKSADIFANKEDIQEIKMLLQGVQTSLDACRK